MSAKNKKQKKAVVLLSGGLDSSTVSAIAIAKDFSVHALSFLYGQRHSHELAFAKKQVRLQNIKHHKMVKIDLRAFGGSALTANIAVPKNRSQSQMDKSIPITYVPARNTIFLSYALAYAEVIGAKDIFIGVNVLDYSGYPDCRPEYIAAFEKLANLATKAGVEGEKMKIHTPLIKLTKSQIIKKGIALGVDYSATTSCYDPVKGVACGRCDSCKLRLKGFKDAAKTDMVKYAR